MMRSLLLLIWGVAMSFTCLAQEEIKIMSYNLLMFPEAKPTGRVDTLRRILDYYQPDLFAVQELLTISASQDILDNALNHSGQKYKAADFVPASSGDLHQMLYYNSDKISLYKQATIPTNLRDINEYTLYFNTDELMNGDTVFLDVYVAHLKAGSDSQNENIRNQNVNYLINRINTLPANRNRILMGDFNVYRSTETAFSRLTTGTNPYFSDPINSTGNWHVNAFYKGIMTQSTRSNALFGEGSGGGMDDRFDFILCHPFMLNDDYSLHYKANSYSALGNDGTCFNSSILSCSATPIQKSLYYMSDHLPVVATFQLETKKLNKLVEHSSKHEKAWYADGIITLDFIGEAKVKMFNSDGLLVYSFVKDRVQKSINLEQRLSKGLYYLQINDSYLKVPVL